MDNLPQIDKSNDINIVYSFFYTYNYTNTESTSSYALPFAGFVFVPRLDESSDFLSSKRIVWDFGDGTTVEAVTARHAYKTPGVYTVTNYLYDRNGNSYINSFKQNVEVRNFIEDSVFFLSPSDTNISIRAGEVTPSIPIGVTYSYQGYNRSPNITIVPFASGSQDLFNFYEKDYSNIRYSHLYLYSSFLQLQTNNNITEFVEVSGYNIELVPVYCKLVSNNIEICQKYDTDSFLCGVSGMTDVYYKSDITQPCINLMFGLEPGSIHSYCNTTTIGLSCEVVENISINNLSITSNGIDSEGTTEAVFGINKNKFSDTEISFVVKTKDIDNFTVKSIPQLSNINFILTDGITEYPAIFLEKPITTPINTDLGGFFKGVCISENNTTLHNVYISAYTVCNSVCLTGVSNTFNIYPKDGIYNISKKGENIDFAEKFKEISFQSLFEDLNVLYNDYIKNIFGSITSEQTSIGKTTYEKIRNFVDNVSIIDYSNVDKLLSIFKMLNLTDTQFSSVNYRYPASIARLIDLLSIKRTYLFGTQNKYDTNFRTYGYINHESYGKNLGEQLSIYDSLTIDDDVVCFEKFSGKFQKVSSYLPIQVEQTSTYSIIDYKDSWGWGLVLPPSGFDVSIENYYLFYRYIPGIEGTICDGIIDFTDPNTTLYFSQSSYDEWANKDGVISNIIANQFYKGLNLIK